MYSKKVERKQPRENPMNYTYISNNGLEFIIHPETKVIHLTLHTYSRLAHKHITTCVNRADALVIQGDSRLLDLPVNNTNEILRVIPESVVIEWILRDSEELTQEVMHIGIRGYLLDKAGVA